MEIYTSKYFQLIFIILNVNNDPCFEDKSSSLTLKYRPVHFFESSCMLSNIFIQKPTKGKFPLLLKD